MVNISEDPNSRKDKGGFSGALSGMWMKRFGGHLNGFLFKSLKISLPFFFFTKLSSANYPFNPFTFPNQLFHSSTWSASNLSLLPSSSSLLPFRLLLLTSLPTSRSVLPPPVLVHVSSIYLYRSGSPYSLFLEFRLLSER